MKRTGKRIRPRKIPEVLTPEEQARFLATLEPTDTLSKLRNLALLRVCLNSGPRISELIAFRLRDLDLKTGQLMVRNGKGGKDRSLWLSPEDLELVKDWLTHRPGQAEPQDHLFTNLSGAKPVCERWFRALVVRLAAQAGIAKRISPHSLRHSFASDLLRATKNLFLVSKALGHSNLSTTQIYLHLVDGEMEAALKNLRNGEVL